MKGAPTDVLRGAPFCRQLALVSLVALLTACGNTPPAQKSATKSPPPAVRTPARPAASPPSPPPTVAMARPTPPSIPLDEDEPPPPTRYGGGFYKDDGPGRNPPSGLRAIPDAVPRAEPLSARGNKPYRVFGRLYTPRTRIEPFVERGVASWYGRRFHGKKTSSGEPYDMYAMTAAHPTLPIPSYARVTNLANGRSVVVRINDRGPFLHGRIMDLSYTAALKLGYTNRGSAQVEVEQLVPGAEDTLRMDVARGETVPEPPQTAPQMDEDADPVGALMAAIIADNPPTATKSPNITPNVTNASIDENGSGQNLFLQLGVFASRENAEGFRRRVALRAVEFAGLTEVAVEEGRFRVYTGPFVSPDAARAAAERLGEQLDIRPFAVWRTAP